MPLDLSELENVKQRGGKTIARCPACAKEGRDKKGEHLVVGTNGKFACILYPGEQGKEHRRLIFQMVRNKQATLPDTLWILD